MSEGIIIAIITIIPSITTLIVSSVTNHKVKKQNDFREEIKSELKKLDAKIDDNRKKVLRNILVNDYSELIKGKKKTKEQIQDVEDNVAEYKQLGGDSYIDDLHEIWKEKEIRKDV
jgi:Fe2+ transport system protein B